jgi:hypothetical protein
VHVGAVPLWIDSTRTGRERLQKIDDAPDRRSEMIKNWMLWVAIVITILLAGFIISRLPVHSARGESPAPAIGNQAMERTATTPAR